MAVRPPQLNVRVGRRGLVLAPVLVPLGMAVAAVALTACAAPAATGSTAAPGTTSPSSVIPSTAIPSSASQPARFAEDTSATPSPTAAAAATPTSTAAATPTTPTSTAATTAPHFASPDDAVRYLVAAYNADDETSLRHVSTPASRAQFEQERQWVQAFAFRSCAKDGVASTYTCTLDIATRVPDVATASPSPTAPVDPSMNEVTIVVGPADRPGWYLEQNMGCGD